MSKLPRTRPIISMSKLTLLVTKSWRWPGTAMMWTSLLMVLASQMPLINVGVPFVEGFKKIQSSFTKVQLGLCTVGIARLKARTQSCHVGPRTCCAAMHYAINSIDTKGDDILWLQTDHGLVRFALSAGLHAFSKL